MHVERVRSELYLSVAAVLYAIKSGDFEDGITYEIRF